MQITNPVLKRYMELTAQVNALTKEREGIIKEFKAQNLDYLETEECILNRVETIAERFVGLTKMDEILGMESESLKNLMREKKLIEAGVSQSFKVIARKVG